MTKTKKWLGATLAATLMVAMLPASAFATSSGDFWTSGGDNMPPKSTLRMVWKDAITDGIFFSTDPRNLENSKTAQTALSRNFNTVLGICGAKLEPGCISSVDYKVENEWKSAVLQPSPGQRAYAGGVITPDLQWDIFKSSLYRADPAAGIFSASEPNLFAFPGASHRLGENYLVNAVVTSEMNSGKARITGIDISVWGVQVSDNCSGEDYVETHQGSYCNTLVNIPKDLEIRTSVYLGARIKELSGWFDGRMIDPSIDFGVEKPGYVSVRGKPVEVSTAITSFIPKGDPLYDVTAEVEQMQGEFGEPRQSLGRADGIQNWNRFGSKVLQKAVSTNTYWRLSSWLGGNQGQYSCPNISGVRGVVISNAAAYTPTAPTLNRTTGSLDFEVASTHYKANGDLNDGFYDLLLNEKIAKCIWGAGVSGNNASISVVNADGSVQVATTTFAISGGWAKFKAYGYHYSKPKISVNLSKSKASAPQKSTITCVKGKLTKKVTAVNAKCPTGYKKKP